MDKNLKLHGLIQAFSRTNGILNSAKTFGNCNDHEIVVDIERCISTLLALRDKRELVEKFIESMSAGEDARAAWHEYIKHEMKAELDEIIESENLKPDETKAFIESAFADGGVDEDGTAITKILKPRSRFGKNAGYSDSKTRVVDKLKAYFTKYREVYEREVSEFAIK